MALTVTMLATASGRPYTPSTPPTIDIWRVSDGVQVVTAGAMSQVGITSFFYYSFASGNYGISYVYTVTGEASLTPSERFKYGSIYQEVPDRIFANAVSNAGNTVNTFQTNLTGTVTNLYINSLLLFTTGLQAQTSPQQVTAFNTSTGFITVTPGLPLVPSAGDQFVLIDF